jgi:hypothetical protein
VERKLQSLRDEALRTFSMAMRNQVMKKILSCTLVTVATIGVGASVIRAEKVRAGGQFSAGPESGRQTWPEDDSGLKLPAGFCATVFADGQSAGQEMAVER